MKNYEELTLNGDDFASLRNDFDCMIQKLLLMMQQNNSEEGTINVKATISTVPACVDLGDGNVEEVFKPIITHKIEYTVPVKGSKSGMHDTGKKIVYNKDLQEDKEAVFDRNLFCSICRIRSALFTMKSIPTPQLLIMNQLRILLASQAGRLPHGAAAAVRFTICNKEKAQDERNKGNVG